MAKNKKLTSFSVKESDSELLISHKGDKVIAAIAILIPGAFLAFILYMMLIVNDNPIDLVLAYLTFPGIIGGASIYYGVCVIVNLKVIIVTDKYISSKSTPLPTFNAKKVKLDDIKDLYYEAERFHTKHGGYQYIYNLVIENKNNRKAKVILFASGEVSELEFLEAKIKNRLELNKR